MTAAAKATERRGGTGCAAFMLLLVWSTASTVATAQFAEGQRPAPAAKSAAGERWRVTTVQEFQAAKDGARTMRDPQQELVCYPRGSVSLNSAANGELPAELKDKCWLSDQRTEARRQQTKYACHDGTSAEVATRQEADGSFGSQVVVNMAEKGGIAVTRSLRRMPGTCDPYAAKAPGAPGAPVSPVTPVAPVVPVPEMPAK